MLTPPLSHARSATLERGQKQLSDMLAKLSSGKGAEGGKASTLGGPDAFLLYDSFGFPLELTQEMAEQQGVQVGLVCVPGMWGAMCVCACVCLGWVNCVCVCVSTCAPGMWVFLCVCMCMCMCVPGMWGVSVYVHLRAWDVGGCVCMCTCVPGKG